MGVPFACRTCMRILNFHVLKSSCDGCNNVFPAVLISGSNLFGHARNITSITFGGVEADIDFTNSINSLIRVRVQPNDVTIDTPVLVVITAATMARVSTNGNDWMYLVPGRVNDVEPSSGQAGTVVTITGELKQCL